MHALVEEDPIGEDASEGLIGQSQPGEVSSLGLTFLGLNPPIHQQSLL